MANKILRTFQDKSTKLWGCKDKDGNIVIAPEWNWIAEANGSADFQNGLCAVKKKEGKKKAMFGYINVAGELVIPCKYDAAESFKEGMAIVKKGEKYFMIDKAGEKKSNEYDIIFHCEEGMRKVELKFNHGFINAKGKEVIPPVWSAARMFKNGYSVVKGEVGETEDGDGIYKYGAINKAGKLCIPCEYDQLCIVGDTWLTLQGATASLMDFDGNTVTPPVKEKKHHYRVEMTTKGAYEISLMRIDEADIENIGDAEDYEDYFDSTDYLTDTAIPLDENIQPIIQFTAYDDEGNMVYKTPDDWKKSEKLTYADNFNEPWGIHLYSREEGPFAFATADDICTDADMLNLVNQLVALYEKDKDALAPGYYLAEYNELKWQTRVLHVCDDGEFDPHKFCMVPCNKYPVGARWEPMPKVCDVEHLVYNGRMVEVEEYEDVVDNYGYRYFVICKREDGYWRFLNK